MTVPDRLVMAVVALIGASSAMAEPADYPRITRLAPSDVVFRQVQDSIAQGYKAEKGSDPYPDLFLCEWMASGGEDLFAVAARLSLPYETLATLNGMGKPRQFLKGERVLVPSVAGLFVPDSPRNDMDLLLSSRPVERGGQPLVRIVVATGSKGGFTFYPGARLYQTERSFFLNVGFRMPLPEGILSSSYGFRRSPIDGHDRMHEGVDLAAPLGTAVLAAREGRVIAAGNDPVLGLRVILDHDGGLVTIYGHLSSIVVVLNQSVLSGTMIAAVGSTGLSTGPHLHFEIRLGGKARDPSSYVPGLKP